LIIPMICSSVKRLFLIHLLLRPGQTLHQIEEASGGQVSHHTVYDQEPQTAADSKSEDFVGRMPGSQQRSGTIANKWRWAAIQGNARDGGNGRRWGTACAAQARRWGRTR
jgi:hypothetical protein